MTVACQPRCSWMRPDAGSPIPPPMPSVALINATAAGTFWRGSSSRRMLMPTG